jgi:hypothetical protein
MYNFFSYALFICVLEAYLQQVSFLSGRKPHAELPEKYVLPCAVGVWKE